MPCANGAASERFARNRRRLPSTHVAAPGIMRTFPLLLLAACTAGSSPSRHTTPGSRGPRADAHLQAARDHEARAAELARWPEMQRDGAGFDQPTGGLWYRKWDTVEDERRNAEYHRSSAARLHAIYETECANVASTDIKVS